MPEHFALLNLLVDTIEADRYPMSPRIRLLREILRKFGEIGPASPPELAQKLRRYSPPPPARPPTLRSVTRDERNATSDDTGDRPRPSGAVAAAGCRSGGSVPPIYTDASP